MITDNTEVEINSVLASVTLFLRDTFQEMEPVYKSFKLTPTPQGSTPAPHNRSSCRLQFFKISQATAEALLCLLGSQNPPGCHTTIHRLQF